MHIKATKHDVGEQLKNESPDWHRLSREEKKQSPRKW